jgi:sulfatase modifying factor 1
MIRKALLCILLTACGTATVSGATVEQNHKRISTPTIIKEYKPCNDDMVYIERDKQKFCIDRYEFPNKQGEYPISAIDAHQAESLCESVDKRICSYGEWYQACVGKENLRFSYGGSHKDYCNDNKTGWVHPKWELMGSPEWKGYAKTLYKGEPSGGRQRCKSDEGVFDLLGNVREWVKDPSAPYGYVIPGSYWYGDMQTDPNIHLSCKYVIRNHAASFGSYEFGARCCRDVK